MTSTPTPGPRLRIGDADRLAAADQLAAHTAAGRLTLTEHDHRVAAVWAARTAADLDALFADLPATSDHRPTGLPAATITVLAALVVAAVLVAWLAMLVNPALATTMMAACM